MTTVNASMATELRELIEDSVEHFCDENMVSGEMAWIMVGALCEAKYAQLKGKVL